MVYMDEWEYNLWLAIHKKELTSLLSVEKTGSGEVEGLACSSTPLAETDTDLGRNV